MSKIIKSKVHKLLSDVIFVFIIEDFFNKSICLRYMGPVLVIFLIVHHIPVSEGYSWQDEGSKDFAIVLLCDLCHTHVRINFGQSRVKEFLEWSFLEDSIVLEKFNVFYHLVKVHFQLFVNVKFFLSGIYWGLFFSHIVLYLFLWRFWFRIRFLFLFLWHFRHLWSILHYFRCCFDPLFCYLPFASRFLRVLFVFNSFEDVVDLDNILTYLLWFGFKGRWRLWQFIPSTAIVRLTYPSFCPDRWLFEVSFKIRFHQIIHSHFWRG